MKEEKLKYERKSSPRRVGSRLEREVDIKKYIGKYTGAFLVLMGAMLLPLLAAGKSLIWTTDGKSQYYPYLYYMGRYLREFLQGLSGGDISARMYDFALGMGDDVNAVFRSHPLDFLSVLVPGRYTELLYHFLIILRIYLAGLSFSAFCLYWKKRENAVLAGSMIYISCGYVLKLGLMHPTFDSPLIVLPILLLGAEQVLRGGSSLLFSFAVGLGFISNYYFMYMCTLALAGYVILRFFDLYRKRRIRNLFVAVLRMGGAYLLGAGLVAAVLFPTVARLMSSLRVGSQTGENLLYYEKLQRYYMWFVDLISPYRNTGSNTHLNCSVLVLPALVLLFARRWREKLALKLAVIAEIGMLLIPAAGYVMGGFANVNNRWIFIMIFTLAVICVLVWEDFFALRKAEKYGLTAVLVIFAGIVLVSWFTDMKNAYGLIALAELAVCTVLLLLADRMRKEKRKLISTALAAVILLSAGLNGYFTYSDNWGDTASEFTDCGKTMTDYLVSPQAKLAQIEDSGFYRVDTSIMSTGNENSSIMLGYQGISMYNSIVNGNLLEYLLDQENPGANAVHRIFGMDGRTVSEALANVKYYMTEEDGEKYVPYGYKLREDLSADGYEIYENQYPLQFGYTYDTTIARSYYEKLTPLEKQQVMMEAVLVEDQEMPEGLKQIQTSSDEIITIEAALPDGQDGLKRTANGYKVSEQGASLELPYETKAGYECYVRLVGLDRDKEYSFVDISTSDISKTLTVRGKNAAYTLGRSNYLVYLGSGDEEKNDKLKIIFRTKGTYKLEKIELCYVPLEHFAERVEARNSDAMEDAVFEKNKISGHINLDESRFVVFSIPYSSGWSAEVDGQSVSLQKANAAYLGLKLDAGEHEIVLNYVSPGSRAGILVTVVCAVTYVIVLIRWLRRRKTSDVR